MTLPRDQFISLQQHVLTYLNSHRETIAPDYAWIRPLLIEVGLDHELNPILVNQVASNQVPLDLEFLRAMNIDPAAHRRRAVYPLLEGFWYVVRQSTDDAHHERPARYNVSLLSVKPVEYPVWSDNPKTLFTSKTLVPHF